MFMLSPLSRLLMSDSAACVKRNEDSCGSVPNDGRSRNGEGFAGGLERARGECHVKAQTQESEAPSLSHSLGRALASVQQLGRAGDSESPITRGPAAQLTRAHAAVVQASLH